MVSKSLAGFGNTFHVTGCALGAAGIAGLCLKAKELPDWVTLNSVATVPVATAHANKIKLFVEKL